MKNSHLIKILDVNREQEYQALRTKGVGQTTIKKIEKWKDERRAAEEK